MSLSGRLLREIRRASGLSRRELARRARTSNAALIGYEQGRHDPGLATMVRLADAGDCDLVIEVRPRLSTPELRTLEMHRAIADKFAADPSGVRRTATRNLAHLRAVDDGHAGPYFDVWERLLAGPDEVLRNVMTSTDQVARDLRQASPFAGVLSDDERLDVLLRTDGIRVAAASNKSLDQLRDELSSARYE